MFEYFGSTLYDRVISNRACFGHRRSVATSEAYSDRIHDNLRTFVDHIRVKLLQFVFHEVLRFHVFLYW